MIWFVVLLALLTPILWYYYGHLKAQKQIPGIPIIRSFLFPWSLLTFDDKLSFIKYPWKQHKVGRENNNVWRFVTGANYIDADVFKQVGVTKAKHFQKPFFMKGQTLPGTTNNNIVAADREEWRRKRELCNPSFTDLSLLQIFDQHMHKVIDRVVQKWRKTEGSVNAAKDARNLAFNAIAKAGFGLLVEAVNHPNTKSVNLINLLLSSGNGIFIKLLPTFFKHLPVIGEQIRTKEEKGLKVKAWFEMMIQERKKAHKDGDIEQNIVSRLLTAENKEFSKFDDQDLLTESVVLLVAGHETTAKTLRWTFYHLAMHPEIQQRAYEEITSVMSKHGYSDLKDITYDVTMNEFPYIKAIINKTLRLSGPAALVFREVAKDVEIQYDQGKKNVTLLKGTMFIGLAASSQLNPDAWDNVKKFQPERFRGSSTKIHFLAIWRWCTFMLGKKVCRDGNVSVGNLHCQEFQAEECNDTETKKNIEDAYLF